MIINFNNLGGGGGGGSYTLPVATASRLGGVKVGSGLSITSAGTLSVTGGSSSDGQKLWSAATPADLASLTGASEGDVCVVSAYYDEMPENFNMYLDWGWGFFSAWANYYSYNDVPPSLRFTLVENQYWDGQDASSIPNGAYAEFEHSHENQQQETVYDVVVLSCDDPDYKYFYDTDLTQNPDPSEYVAFSGVGDSIIVNSSDSFNGGSGSNDSLLFELTGNTSYKYAIRIEQEIAAATYQLNNGEWIKLASADDVASAMTMAEDAYNLAGNMVAKDNPGLNDWSSITYFNTFIGEVSVNNVDQGYRIHVPGASTERENPKVTEIVTSGDVGRIVALTQTQYDQMQTHDNNTLYAIIPDTN